MSGLAIPLPPGCGPHGGSSTALTMSVLVLNRSFVAVHVTNVRRAISLLFRELAEVVHIEEGHFAAHTLESWRELSAMRAAFPSPDQDWVRAVGYQLQAPRVIRLVACDRGPRRTPAEARMNLVRQPVKPKRSPLLSLKLGNPKYASWKSFVDSAYWTVDLK